jgi:hypothetical protein
MDSSKRAFRKNRLHFSRSGKFFASMKESSEWLKYHWPVVAASAILALALAPLALGESVVVVQARPSPLLRLKQKARITVLADGKPLPGLKVDVWQDYRAGKIAALITDGDGNLILPELPSGRYFIGSLSPGGLGFSGNLEVCIVPCSDDGFETTDFVQESLDGQLHVIDRDAFALNEIWMEIGIASDSGWGTLVKSAEQEPAAGAIQRFRGVVQDQTGAVIPGASIDIVVKGTQGRKHSALLRADYRGSFSADLPNGDYVAVISSPGFRVRALPFTISAAATTSDLKIVLVVGSVTQTSGRRSRPHPSSTAPFDFAASARSNVTSGKPETSLNAARYASAHSFGEA